MWQARKFEGGRSADSGDFILPPNAGRSADSDCSRAFSSDRLDPKVPAGFAT
jgi:hypothetical protein